MIDAAAIRVRWETFGSKLDERGRRLESPIRTIRFTYWPKTPKFREALLMSENGYEQENRAPHLRDFANHPRLHYGAASKGKKAVLDVVELDVARGGARSRCFQ
jgi:hypothetical protein